MTNEQKHTPGPWKLYGELNVENYANEYVCSCGQNGRIEVSKANARLIASAPELLEACKATLIAIEGADDQLERQIKQAISKAQGETR